MKVGCLAASRASADWMTVAPLHIAETTESVQTLMNGPEETKLPLVENHCSTL